MNIERKNLDHESEKGWPVIDSPVFYSEHGVPYLKAPGLALISRPSFSLAAAIPFLANFPDEYGFDKYTEDPKQLNPGEGLSKFAGQTCYASFGPKRTMNSEAEKYFSNIISSGHGSVLEHPNFSFLVYGVSRSLTHELVRHRAGMGYSQLSQRYVSDKTLRFVERKEYQDDPSMHMKFEKRIEFAAKEYKDIADYLQHQQLAGESKILSAEAKTDLRKKVQQSARSVLPNETETWVVVTGNVRAWRHVVNMRASEHAETEIREWAYRAFKILKEEAPILFGDMEEIQYGDGTFGVKTDYPKV